MENIVTVKLEYNEFKNLTLIEIERELARGGINVAYNYKMRFDESDMIYIFEQGES